MNKRLLIYGILLALLVIGLKLAEYKFVMLHNAIELYGGLIALLFTGIGIMLGIKFMSRGNKQAPSHNTTINPVSHPGSDIVAAPISAPPASFEDIGLSKREYEILLLMAEGLSNQEIAERSYVSIHTVKTHVSNILLKLDAKRRTQAVVRARELKII